MMAKMFYTLDEAKTTLGKSEDEVKQLVREGKLREFRDGPRLMFKADQVEQLKNEIAAGPAGADAGSSGTGMVIGLSDLPGSGFGSGAGSGAGSGIGSGAARSGTGSGSGAIAMAGSGLGSGMVGSGIGSGAGSGQIGIQGSGQIGIQGSGAMSMNLKDDTALAADLGLSGSVSGTPSPGRGGSASGISGSGGASGSRAGIDVFQADEVDRADPSAQTAINPSIGDQLNLEGVGSGSGLLDLTRESDDTSLGAELLDEIAPGGSKAGATPRSPAESGAIGSGMAAASAGPVTIQRGPALPTYERPDPWASALGAAALGAVGVLLFSAFALIAGVLGTHPAIIEKLGGMSGPPTNGFAMWQVAAAAVGVCAVFFAVGYMVGGKAAK